MLQALLAGVASIKAQQTRMNVIGNNLANVNTTAYKGSRVTFQDMIAQTIRGAARPTDKSGGTNPIQYGLGVLVGGTDVNNEQGSLNATNRPTDFAIQGNGFLLVSNGDSISYTRDGACDLDASGNLVHSATGQRVLGWMANTATGQIDTNQPIGPDSTLTIPIGARTAVQVTTDCTWAGNLDSRLTGALPAAAPPFVSGTPPTVNNSYLTANVRVYDQLGQQHDLTVGLVRIQIPAGGPTGAVACWEWAACGKGDLGVSGMATVTRSSGGLLYFDSNGQLITNTTPQTITVTPAAGGAPAFSIRMNFNSISQLAAESQFQASDQNGFPPGSLQGFSMGTDGVITGIYTNGLTRPLGQIATAIFPNANGLERIGNNLWRSTDNSGVPVVGTPKSGGRGAVNSGYLEQSNVDIGSEFTDLIVTQRGFQANTKVVTTVDEMLQELLNMKR